MDKAPSDGIAAATGWFRAAQGRDVAYILRESHAPAPFSAPPVRVRLAEHDTGGADPPGASLDWRPKPDCQAGVVQQLVTGVARGGTDPNFSLQRRERSCGDPGERVAHGHCEVDSSTPSVALENRSASAVGASAESTATTTSNSPLPN